MVSTFKGLFFFGLLVKVETGTPKPVATPARSLGEGSAPRVPDPPRSLTGAEPDTPPTQGGKSMTDRKVQC